MLSKNHASDNTVFLLLAYGSLCRCRVLQSAFSCRKRADTVFLLRDKVKQLGRLLKPLLTRNWYFFSYCVFAYDGSVVMEQYITNLTKR